MSRKIIQYQKELTNDASDTDMDEKVVITTYNNKEIAAYWKQNRLRSLSVIENDSKIGNIYIGKVKNVVKNLDACFVEIDNQEIAYLPISEAKFPLLVNRTYDGRIIQGDELLVQVQKDAIKTKQACLSANVSVSSKYFVFTLEKASLGISHKLDKDLREQLKTTVKENDLISFVLEGEKIDVSTVLRTEGGILYENNPQEFLTQYCKEKEAFIQLLNKAKHLTCFTCIKGSIKPYKAVLERFSVNDRCHVITDLYEAYTSLQEAGISLRYYEDSFPLTKIYGLESKIEEALRKKVWLSSGGYLVIEQTECLATIDVNSGKMIKGTEREKSIWKINEEAAYEAAIQIRLRNLSGIIIIDFINMDNFEDDERLIQLMKELVRNDPVYTNIIDITPLGLMEITRKKIHKSLKEQLSYTELEFERTER